MEKELSDLDEVSVSSKSSSGKETWGKKVDFLLSIIGFAVDLANVWRFPYLCYKNGGGAFLIPYFLMLIFGALPLFFMELCLGQFLREGPISVWKISPIFKGVGIAECLIAYFVAFYYNVIIAWSFFYLFHSFTRTLPWTTCGNSWNTEFCDDGTNRTMNVSLSGVLANQTSNVSYTGVYNNKTVNRTVVTSAAEYFERGVLGLHESDGFTDMGAPRWELFLCLLGVFVILYLALWKGVKTSGKVVWVTATMPYVVLTVLLIRGAFLPGAKDGVLYYVTPHLERLADSQVWIDAAIQIFYSCGAGFGVHLAYSSYNKFHNNCYRDCIATACVNSFTSLFSGFVIFMYLGYMAQKQKVEIGEVAQEGPGLVFIVYPEAIATLPGSTGWAIIFFVMLLTLGLDSAMGGLEAVLTGLGDEFRPFFKKYRYGREVFTAVVIATVILTALGNITNGGMYLFHIWDTFAAGTSILFAVFAQCVAVSWVYGLEDFCNNIERMIGFKPNLYWRICWKFISPIFLFVVIVSSIVKFKPLDYATSFNEYIFPGWANAMGWCIAGSSMIMVPAAAIYHMLKMPGSFSRRLALCISPVWEHKAIKRGKPVKRFQLRHWLKI